jgi:hypothetical protein
MLSRQAQGADGYAENPAHSFVLYAIRSLFLSAGATALAIGLRAIARVRRASTGAGSAIASTAAGGIRRIFKVRQFISPFLDSALQALSKGLTYGFRKPYTPVRKEC